MTARYQSGAVSLFIVVFTAILFAVAAVSFTRLTVQDQRQATVEDVSQSAYDSALAGVEDAKRLATQYNACKANQGVSADCAKIMNNTILQSCDSLAQTNIVTSPAGKETLLRRSAGDTASAELSQAYTCVKINPNPKDYISKVEAGNPTVVPIKLAPGSSSFTFRWFSRDDIPKAEKDKGNYSIKFPAGAPSLPSTAQWANGQVNVPPLMRLQIVQARDSGGSIADFDTPGGSNTALLYPVTTAAGTISYNMSSAGRATPAIANAQPVRVSCSSNIAPGGPNDYACYTTITIDSPSPDKTLFITVTPLYSGAHFMLENSTGGPSAPPLAQNPQFEVDSTGRANNLFRRVIARIEIGGNMASFPSASVAVKQGFCKDYIITNSQQEDYYSTNGSSSCYSAR